MSAMNDRNRKPLLWLAMAIVFAVRYARGEITREEYLRFRADLEGRIP